MGKKKSFPAVTEPNTAENLLTAQYLQQIANCLAYLTLQTDSLKGKDNNDLIPILTGWGFDRHAIASLLQTTPETVSVCMSVLKAKLKAKSLSKKIPESTGVSSE
jgi:hypothetical protein